VLHYLNTYEVEVICKCGTLAIHRSSQLLRGVSRGCKFCVAKEFAQFDIKGRKKEDTDKYPQSTPEEEARMIKEFLDGKNK